MDKLQQKQEDQYVFPYHYIPKIDGGFSQSALLKWGYVYLSYLSFVIEKLKGIHFESLLDVGCGDGRFLYEAHKHFPRKELEGVDYSGRAISFAKAFNPDLQFYTGDITDNTVLNKKYDVITLIETLEHIPPKDIDAFLRGIAAHVSENGTFILTVPSDNMPVSKKHYQHFNLESLRKTLEPSFVISEHHFINQKGFRNTLLCRILSNRFFILNQHRTKNFLYRYYTRNLRPANEKNGKRIVAICHKKNGRT